MGNPRGGQHLCLQEQLRRVFQPRQIRFVRFLRTRDVRDHDADGVRCEEEGVVDVGRGENSLPGAHCSVDQAGCTPDPVDHAARHHVDDMALPAVPVLAADGPGLRHQHRDGPDRVAEGARVRDDCQRPPVIGVALDHIGNHASLPVPRRRLLGLALGHTTKVPGRTQPVKWCSFRDTRPPSEQGRRPARPCAGTRDGWRELRPWLRHPALARGPKARDAPGHRRR